MFLLRNRRGHQTAHRRDVEYGRCLPQASVTMGMSYHVIDRAGGAMAAFKLITAGGARLVLLTLLLVVATRPGRGGPMTGAQFRTRSASWRTGSSSTNTRRTR